MSKYSGIEKVKVRTKDYEFMRLSGIEMKVTNRDERLTIVLMKMKDIKQLER